MNNKYIHLAFMRILSCVLLSMLVYSLVPPLILSAEGSSIIITEIAAYEGSDHEWIEIYNRGSGPVDLTGWKFFEQDTNHGLSAYRDDLIIEPGEYAIIADKAENTETDYPDFVGTLIDSSWSTLTEAGEHLALKDSAGDIVEEFTYIAAPDFSLERIDLDLDDYTESNWKEHVDGNTIGLENSVHPDDGESGEEDGSGDGDSDDSEHDDETTDDSETETNEEYEDDSSSETGSSGTSPLLFTTGEVVINELVSDPLDEEVEWIELYSNSWRVIDLSGWSIEEGSESITPLSGTLGTDAGSRFFVVEKPKGSLNNGGDMVTLYSPDRVIIDRVTYGSWDDGTLENNAPRSSDPSSLARVIDGASTYNNANDFRTTLTPTKGVANIITSDSTNEEGESGNSDFSFVRGLIFTEALPNPLGPDTDSEFLELYNAGVSAIDIADWELVNGSGTKYRIRSDRFDTTIIEPGDYFSLPRTATKIALKNTGGDSIKLYQPGGTKPNATLSYLEKAESGLSYALVDGSWVWTTTPTEGLENIFTTANRAPLTELTLPDEVILSDPLVFDASDSTDPDGDVITFAWDFGDGNKAGGAQITHTYTKTGRYSVVLEVSDGIFSTRTTRTVTVKTSLEPTATPAPKASPVSTGDLGDFNQGGPSLPLFSSVVLNEVFPNPDGNDDDEFIELLNTTTESISLDGWRISLSSGRKYLFPTGTFIEAGVPILLPKSESKLSLVNTQSTIVLYDADGMFTDVISYEDAPSGQSLARTDTGDLVWSLAPSPGDINVLDFLGGDFVGDPDTFTNTVSPSVSASASSSRSSASSSSKTSSSAVITTTIEGARALPLDSRVRVRGIVSVLPGVLGTQIFYISGSGMQVYSSKKDFPTLRVGDVVEVTGTLSETQGERRIKTSSQADIHVVGHVEELTPREVSAPEVYEETEGQLVIFSGDVMDVKWPNVYLDDGLDEIRVYVKSSTGIKRPPLEQGDHVTVVGIVSQTSSGYRLLPRSENDIVIEGAVSEAASPLQEETLVESHVESNARVGQYLVASVLGLAFLIGGFFVQMKVARKEEK